MVVQKLFNTKHWQIFYPYYGCQVFFTKGHTGYNVRMLLNRFFITKIIYSDDGTSFKVHVIRIFHIFPLLTSSDYYYTHDVYSGILEHGSPLSKEQNQTWTDCCILFLYSYPSFPSSRFKAKKIGFKLYSMLFFS